MLTACSGSPNTDWDASTDDASTDSGGTDGTTKDSSIGDASKADASDGGVKDSGTIVADSGDGFAAVRTACINEINKLRTQNGHQPYALWETSAIDQCVDEQATYDQQQNSAHDAWLHDVYPTCNGNAQDECLGYGNTVQGIISCLDSMWAERTQPNCSSCDSCNSTQYSQQVQSCQNTATCDFYGTIQPSYGECGHYVNMSADYFVEAACGFSTVGSSQDWAVQNFQ